MVKNKKVELLAPAGNPEKLEIAIHYGADAVYLAGKDFSLRSFSGNFTLDEMEKGIKLARENKVKVYVACNIYSRNYDQEDIDAYLRDIKKIRPDGIIVADPGIFMAAKKIIPEIPIHISTQANTTNYRAALFWQGLGASRINMARELSLKEIKQISMNTRLEIEAFVHGAMCISYSGRCLLSSFMENRESNRGLCCHPCRFNYAVVEEKRPGQYYPVMEDGRGTYIFNSKDLCMVSHIPEMIKAGIDSLKIEGRMKGINYLATTVKIYREAIDRFYENPDSFRPEKMWADELIKVGHRGYSTGFYFEDPKEVVPNYEKSSYFAPQTFIGKILAVLKEDKSRKILVDVRGKVHKGDEMEILSKNGPLAYSKILGMTDGSGNPVSPAQPNSKVFMKISAKCSVNDIIRKKYKGSEI